MSKRKKENPLDMMPLAKKKPVSQKNPYVFTRACARLLGVDEEQAVAGYLAATSPRKPNPTLPEKPVPHASSTSDSSTGPLIPRNEVEIRKVTQIPNPANVNFPPDTPIQAQVTESASAQGEVDRATSVPHTNPPSDSSTGWPIARKEVELRKVTEIPKPSNSKLPPSPQIQVHLTESTSAPAKGDRATTVPPANPPSDSSTGWPITRNEVELRQVTEIPKPPNVKLPPDAPIQAQVTEPAPAQREGDRATSVPHTNPPFDSGTGRPIIRNEVEIRKVTQIPKPSNIKLPPDAPIQVTESVPAQAKSDWATSLPHANPLSDSSTGWPITRKEVELRQVTEIPKPSNSKLPPSPQIQAQVTESTSAPAKSDRATSLPHANPPSDSSSGWPITGSEVEIRKITQIPKSSNVKLSQDAPIQPQVTPARGEGDRATATGLPHPNPLSDLSTVPLTLKEVETRKVTQIPSHQAQDEGCGAPSNVKPPPEAPVQAQVTEPAPAQGGRRATSLPWRAPAILLLVVLGFAVWGFYTREQDTQVKNPVPPNSNSILSISPPAPGPARQEPESFATKMPASAALMGSASFAVRIKAHKNVWVLIRADGRKLIDEKLVEGTEKLVTAANQVSISTGNPGALDFEFNGQRLQSPGADGEVKTLEFGPSGLEVIVSKPPTKMKPGM